MSDFGTLNAKVSLDTSGFSRGIKDVKDGFTSMGQKAMHLNQALDLVTKGFRTLDQTFGYSIEAASNLQEVHSKFNVVFGSEARKAQEWANSMTDAYAMSQREAEQYMASVQDLLVPMGMTTKGAASLSHEIVKLAADLGSFNNMPTADVMANIQSALVGEYESMKKYGVVLNATVVEHEALNMGLANTKKALTAGDKAQAAYALMVKSSTAAIGDMARTSDGYANTSKRLKAELEDLAATIGAELLPMATEFKSTLIDTIKDPQFQQSVKDFAYNMGNVASAFAGIMKYAGLRSVWGTFDQATQLASKGLIDLQEFSRLGFLERQRVVDDILAKQKEIKALNFDDKILKFLESGSLLNVDPVNTSSMVGKEETSSPGDSEMNKSIAKTTELSDEAKNSIGDLRAKIRDVSFETQITGAEKWASEIKKVKHEAGSMRIEYGAFFKEAPQLDGLIKKWENLKIAQINAQKSDEAKQAIKDLNAQISGVSLEKTIIGMNQWGAALKQVDSDSASLREQYKALINQFPALGEAIAKYSKAKENLIEAQKVEETRKVIKELNTEISSMSFEKIVSSMTAWDASTASIAKSSEDLRTRYKEMFGEIPAGVEEAIKSLGQLKTEQAKIAENKDLKALMSQVPEAYSNLFKFDDDGYSDALKAITDQFNEMNAKGGEMAAWSGIWYDQQKGLLSYAHTVGQVKNAFMSMTGAMSDALVEFAKTGKLSFKDLAKAMYQELVIYAASYTAKLLMTAAFEGAMGLYSLAVGDGKSGLHFGAASAALAQSAMMGSFVAGAGLSGMAHDGISNIPEDGTWLLQKNERVIDSQTNADLKDFLKGGGKGTTIQQNITIQGGDEQGVLKTLPLIKQMAVDAVNASIASRGDVYKTIQIMNPR